MTTARFSTVATALTRAMAAAGQNDVELEPWGDSLERALATGDIYSCALPLTSHERANDIGQVCAGPVVTVVVDAATYSSGDLFASGFVDNDIGTLVCTDDATGGGGANLWGPADVQRSLAGTAFERRPLPDGISYTVAVRSATRSGAGEGRAVEDVGVRGHVRYSMTRRDLTGDNGGLLHFCGALLRDQPRTDLCVAAAGDGVQVVTTTGLDRLDVVVDGRPHSSVDVDDDAPVEARVPAAAVVELLGFADGRLRRRRVLPR